MKMLLTHPLILLLLAHLGGVGSAFASDAQPPREWIDEKTGHRIRHVSPEPYALLPYFTANALSADGRHMAYTSGRGLHLIELETMSTTLLVPKRAAAVQFIDMGRKNNRLYYLFKLPSERLAKILSIDLVSKEIIEHATLPDGYRVESINADESLIAGVFEETPTRQPTQPGRKKAEILYGRFQEKIPMALFTIDLRSGRLRTVHASTDWLSHPQFSPVDPGLLMYSLEGPWHLVDRIWTIRTDGSERTLVHRRTMDMEITGHEFWSVDGRYIHYDWQSPKGKVFQLASYDIASGRREAFPLTAAQWSIHFNASSTPNVFVGDGADRGQVARSRDSAYIQLYRRNTAATGNGQPTAPSMQMEHLVDLAGHDYRLEPNARLTPDNRWVLFRSNIFGVAAVFAVETTKSKAAHIEVASTHELAKRARAYRDAVLLKE